MSLSNQVSFLKLASVLDEINTSKKDQKSKLLKHFILQFQAEAKKTGKPFDEELSFFPILRLLLPTYDRNRGPYGIKEYTLSKLYVRILCLNRGTKDYIKLTQYKAPKSNLGSEGGDFSEVAYSVLKTRCGKGGELSVADVNKHLDNIAAKHINHDQRGVESELQLLMSKMSALEQRWLIRMLLKDLHVGLGGAHVLNLFHQDARDLYDVCHNLQRVCSVLHNPSSQLHEIEVVLFEPFRPMLSRRLDIQAVETDLRDRDEYYVEPKHDGERFQLHLSGGQFKYFSRNGHEYTSTYGADVTCGILTPHIVPQLSADVESCILDGEMMCWNTKYGTYTSKGGNIDVKKLRLGNIHQPCFCVFDILFYNGTVLSNKPLSERLNILESMLSSRQGVIVHTPRTRIHSKSDILPALNKAIENREEGIVVKEPDAVYKPNSRKDGWYKIKPEYTEGAMVELDMLIIGGYYGKGSQRGIVSQFLLGLLDDSNTPDEGSANSGGPRFVSAGKVGIGLSMEELVDLSQKMSPHWIRTRVNQLPDQIVWNREKPDLWIPPQYSHILQVRATEVVRSESFKVNYCLRFPRIQAVRYDKTSSDCLTVEEFHRIRTQGSGKLCYESITGTGSRAGLPTRSPRKRKEVSLASEYTCTIQDGVTLLSHIFKGKTLCVMTGGDITRKQTLETAILEHSGRLVQNSGPGTWAIVVTDTNNLRVKNAVAANAHNVVLASWVERCVDSKCLVEWIPDEVLSLVGHDKIVFNNKFDCYGDSFTLPLRPSALPPLLSSMNSHPIPLPTPHELLLVERELYSTNGSAVFRGLQVYCVRGVAKLSKLRLRFYGGSVCDEMSEIVTHVVCVSDRDKDNVEEERRINKRVKSETNRENEENTREKKKESEKSKWNWFEEIDKESKEENKEMGDDVKNGKEIGSEGDREQLNRERETKELCYVDENWIKECIRKRVLIRSPYS
uniref:DNA ligase 4 n=2 Tax=Cacopsylla melanoneura TaxID=428564 RepID=A0A8D8QBL3_9HEMI